MAEKGKRFRAHIGVHSLGEYKCEGGVRQRVLFRLKNNGKHPFDCRRMQPGVTVALATVWLAGAVGVFSATLYPSHPSLDQYSPQQSPKHHEVTQETQGHANSKLQDPKDLLTSKHNQTSNVHQPIEMSNLKPPRGTFLPYGILFIFSHRKIIIKIKVFLIFFLLSKYSNY